MNRVRQAKKLDYYHMAAEAVIAELHSHRMGLTNPEAMRRLEQSGPNDFALPPAKPWYVLWLRQLKNPLVLAPLLCGVVFVAYFQQDIQTGIFIGIAVLNAYLGQLLDGDPDRWLASIKHLLPATTLVLRNGQVKKVPVSEIATGDIIELKAGDVVPADLRILTSEDLSIDKTPYVGQFDPETSMKLLAGSTVRSGSAQAIAVATGLYTQLGQMVSVARTFPRAVPLQLAKLTNTLQLAGQAVLLLGIACWFVLWQGQFSANIVFSALTALMVAMLPVGLLGAVAVMLAHTQSSVRRKGGYITKLASVLSLGSLRTLFLSPSDVLTSEMRVRSIVIGRNTYTASGDAGSEDWQLRLGKRPLTRSAFHELSLFFMAIALTRDMSQMHRSQIPNAEAASHFMAAAGFSASRARMQHTALARFTFEGLECSLHQYGKKLALFVQGEPGTVMQHAVQLWDHGHERRFTDADKAFFKSEAMAQQNHGYHTKAFAYRVLSGAVGLQDVEQQAAKLCRDVTLLGFMNLEHKIYPTTAAAVASAKALNISVALLADVQPELAAAVVRALQIGTPDKPTVITDSDFSGLSDGQIINAIANGAAFSQLTLEHKLHLIHTVRSIGYRVAVSIDSPMDIPLVRAADVGITPHTSSSSVKATVDIILEHGGLQALVHAVEQSRAAIVALKVALRFALVSCAGIAITFLCSLLGLVMLHIPLAFNATQLLALLIIVQAPMTAALGWDKARATVARSQPTAFEQPFADMVFLQRLLVFGAAMGVIAYGSFVLFFAVHRLSPDFIDPMNALRAEATSVVFLTLACCQRVNVLFARSETRKRFFTSYLWSNTKVNLAGALALFGILNILYNPLVQPFFGTKPLTIADWLISLLCTTAYVCLRLLQRITRKHSHHAVLQLHRKVNAKAPPARA